MKNTLISSFLVLAILFAVQHQSDCKTSKDRKFFYINVGISTRKLMRWAICLDLAVYFILLVLIIIIRHAAS